jgi:hypothetical protein
MSFRSHAIQSLGLHELVGVPEDVVVVEVGGGVEQEVQQLLPVAAGVDEDVGLEGDGHAGLVAEELEVHLVAAAIFRLRNELVGKGSSTRRSLFVSSLNEQEVSIRKRIVDLVMSSSIELT